MFARRSFLITIACVVLLLVAGCGRDPVTEPAVPVSSDLATAGFDAELAAAEIMAVSGWELDPEGVMPARLAGRDTKALGCVLDWSREVLVGNIAHYTFLLQVGPGAHDRINVHRVVKERRPLRPIRARDNIFLQHGDAVGFVKFLFGHAAPSVPDDHAIAIDLAQRGIDVWGIDQNWVLVPAETTDFAFMQDWGMDNQIGNLRIALSVARLTRLFSGQGFARMPLLGYSSGGWLGMAYINDEAGRPGFLRHVNGFVLADAYYKTGADNEVGREVNCADYAYFLEERANGVYEWWVGFEEVGRYALDDPTGPSPIVDGFTNLQVGLYFGCAGWRDYPLNAWWHYWGGEFDGDPDDPDSLPVDTRFLPRDWAFEFMATASPWQPNAFFRDYDAISCDEVDVPWDDNLAQVTIPVLNFGGAGGLAPSAAHTLSLLGSNDIQEVIVQMLPDDQRTEDFGHIDIFTAEQAPALLWAPLAEWVTSHRARAEDEERYPLTATVE